MIFTIVTRHHYGTITSIITSVIAHIHVYAICILLSFEH